MPIYKNLSLKLKVFHRIQNEFISSMSQPDLAYSFTDVLSLQPSDALTDWKQMTWYIGVWVFFSNVMVHLCAVATSICFLFKHKYARFYSILLALNGIFIPLTVGLITSR